jgi:hypothetical protein
MKLKWSIDQLYFYLICFVMLITIIVGVTTLVRAGIDLIIPYPESGRETPYFPKDYYEYKTPPGENPSQLPADVIERELKEQEEFMADINRRNNVNQAILSLFRGVAMLIVAFPVYLYHWRKIPLLS